jgi:hypothetical protein
LNPLPERKASIPPIEYPSDLPITAHREELLRLIAQHRLVSAPMKRVCANAAARWGSYREEVERAIEAIEKDTQIPYIPAIMVAIAIRPQSSASRIRGHTKENTTRTKPFETAAI